jgi:hypothetical protein
MQYLYIENYLKIPQEQKMKFLSFVNRSKDFKISNEKIVFSEESLMLGFLKDSDIQKAYIKFIDFFKDIKSIKVNKIKQTLDKSNNMVLTFSDSSKQIRI